MQQLWSLLCPKLIILFRTKEKISMIFRKSNTKLSNLLEETPTKTQTTSGPNMVKDGRKNSISCKNKASSSSVIKDMKHWIASKAIWSDMIFLFIYYWSKMQKTRIHKKRPQLKSIIVEFQLVLSLRNTIDLERWPGFLFSLVWLAFDLRKLFYGLISDSNVFEKSSPLLTLIYWDSVLVVFINFDKYGET